jgi:DNA-binding SARP family transcriptional activator/streptogramin lyase
LWVLFRVLGPLEVESENGRLTLGGSRQRAVLATLVLHVNEVVPRDRLLEAVWGESPPDTAASALQGYVSALRKTLGAGVIVTRAPGYALEARPDVVDLRLFESLAAQGADALAAGEATRAAELLREALALWRGEPLADLDSVEFVQLERLRLEELRLGALADRIDADLELGRHAELVGELRSLVREHPLRERFRAQLMLALYRSGRQAEALDVYQQGRSLLAAELGIEPGEPLKRLERSILQQDETIAPPAAAPRPRASPRPRRWSRRLVLAALGVAALAAAAVLSVVFTRTAASAVPVRANSIAVIDTGSNRVVRDIPIDGNPVAIAAGPAGVYVASEREGIVWRIDPRTRRVVRKRGVPYDVHDIAVGFGSVWLADGADGTVTRIDDHLGAIDIISLPQPQPGPPAFWIATGLGRVWVTRGAWVVEINPKNDHVIGRVAIPNPSGLAVGLGAVWVASGHRLTRFKPGEPPVRVSAGPLPAPVLAPAVGEGTVWSIDYNGLGEVSRVSRDGGNLAFVDGRLGRYPLDVAVGDHSAWTIDTRGIVTRIDPATNKPVARVPTAPTIRSALATTDGALWVAIERPR